MSVCFRNKCSVVFFPEKPSNIKIEAGICFEWDASSGKVDGYRIYWGTSKGGPYPFLLCDVNGTKLYYNTSLSKEQTRYFVCRAYNEHGESGNSNEVAYPE